MSIYDIEWTREEGATPKAWYQIKLVLYTDGSLNIVATTNGRTVIGQKTLHPTWVNDLLELLGVDDEAQLRRDLVAKLAKCESPIEREFLEAVHSYVPKIEPQVWVGSYRVDFALPEAKVAIELDGHDFHSSRQQRTNDAKRERQIERDGWRVFRFTGTEIHADVKECALEFYREMCKIGAAELPF